MVLEKQDSGVCLSATEPSSPTDAGGRPVAFFVDMGGPSTGAGAQSSALRSQSTLPKDITVTRTSSHLSARSTLNPRTASDAPAKSHIDSSTFTRRTAGQKLHGESSMKVAHRAP